MVKVGQRLHEERLQRKLSLDDIAAATKIKAQFLQAIETGDYQKLPSPAYAQGFVRNYATYLGLPRTEITALFRREFDEKKAYKVLPDSLTQTDEFPLKRIKVQQSLIVVSILFVLVASYLLFQYRYAFISPSLAVYSPKPDANSREVSISGKADSNAIVSVNNEPVSLNSSGEFTKKITLFPGKTKISVRAKNRFGKETVQTREIVIK